MLLELDDAVNVAIDYIKNNYNCDVDDEDEQILRQEMEQKVWLMQDQDDALKHLIGLIFDVNPAEICSQIQSDNLKNWCKIIQVEMQMCLIKTKTDAISRNALIAKFNSCDLTPDGGIDINEAIDIVLQSPSVQPEVTEEAVKDYCRKRCLIVLAHDCFHKLIFAQQEEAEWIPVESDAPYGILVECSKCGTRTMINDALEHKYCSECGAKMKKG